MNYSAPLKAIIEKTEEQLHQGSSQYSHHFLHEMRRMTQSVESLESLANHRDPRLTEAAHTTRMAEASRKLGHTRDKYKERISALTQEGLTVIERDLKARANLTPTAYAQEIRSAFLSMTHKKRGEVLDKAITEGNSEILAAVLDAPELVTGLDRERREGYKEKLFLTVAPELVAQRDEIMEIFKVGLTVSDTVKKAIDESFDPVKVRKIEEQAQQHQEAAAKFEASLG